MTRPKTKAHAAGLFLAHARWMSDYHRARSRDVYARAVPLLGFSGVLVALLPGVHDRTADLPPTPAALAEALLAVTAVLLLLGAGCALAAMWVRSGPSTNIADVRTFWQEAMSGERLKDDPETTFANWLLHGDSDKPSPLQGESNEANERARWLLYGASALATAITVTVAVLIVLLLEGP